MSAKFGASLSVKQCHNFGVFSQEVIAAALDDLGLRRFRLMSYWDETEKIRGVYDWEELDGQVRQISKAGAAITLCLGARQPRWPETHWPDWAETVPVAERNTALKNFIAAVVNRYKDNKSIVSYQLENEALLKNFGLEGDFDRKRIRDEYKLVKSLDPDRPIIMTTSTSWGIPLRRPIPDIVGFSFYNIVYDKGAYRRSLYQPWIFKLRALLIKLLWRRPSFIHELQTEPWGPKNIWEMDRAEQGKSMSLAQMKKNIELAKATNLKTIDLWGLEWWYWLKTTQQNTECWDFAKATLSSN